MRGSQSRKFVINRHGLWRYMAYYKVAEGCAWDLAVATITTVAIWWASIEHNQLTSKDRLRAEP